MLHVLGRRSDGYHEIDSLVGFAALGDTLTLRPAEAFSLTRTGPFADALPAVADDLVARAVDGAAALAGRPPALAVALTKCLPVAAGLGGGSADAAAALRGCARLWPRYIDATGLQALAASLGADVPVCLAGGPARVGGIGEQLAPVVALPRTPLVLANPGVALATASVYGRVPRRTAGGNARRFASNPSITFAARAGRLSRRTAQRFDCGGMRIGARDRRRDRAAR